jgi:hypothetical protein
MMKIETSEVISRVEKHLSALVDERRLAAR